MAAYVLPKHLSMAYASDQLTQQVQKCMRLDMHSAHPTASNQKQR